MSDNPILGQVALCYSPFIDRNRVVMATRLTVFPLRPDAVLEAAPLLEAVGEVWPPDGARVSLNIVSESLLRDLFASQPSTNLMIEVPAFMASDAGHVEALQRLHAAGSTLLIKGRPVHALPREILPCFKYSIVDLPLDRRVHEPASPPAGVTRTIAHVQAGVHSIAEMEASFARGAAAVLGWPIDDAVASAIRTRKAGAQPDLQVITELIHRVDKQEPIDKLEDTLRRDPTLAFKLIRYINSPAFGLRVEISSFRHAIMMLGYQRLKRWLALLLVTASRDLNLRPVMFAAVRRGLLMEELVRSSGDEEMRNEIFICGAFSLLDRMFGEPFAELLKTIPVPERVHQALVEGSGPFVPYFDLVRALESEVLLDIRAVADTLMVSMAEINRAQLRALRSAAQLD